MTDIGNYIKLPLETWPIPERYRVPELFWAEPVETSEMVRFVSVSGFYMQKRGKELKKLGFAPSLGYFLGDDFHLKFSPAEFVDLKRRLYQKWGFNWNMEERLRQEEWIADIQINVLNRLVEAVKEVKVPQFDLDMEIRGDRIVYVVKES